MTTRTVSGPITQGVNNSGDTNFGYRTRTATLLAPSLGQVRVTIKGSTAASFSVDAVSIGVWDGVATASLNTNMRNAPVPLTFTVSSVSSFIIAGGVSVVSNWASLTNFTSANQLVVAINLASINGNSAHNTTVITGTQTNYYSATDTSSVQTSTLTPGTAATGTIEAVILVEAQPTDAFNVLGPVNPVKGISRVVSY